MGKYDNLKFFKATKARTVHICSECGTRINTEDIYFSEELKDNFLHSLHRKKLCKNCYEKTDFRRIR